MKTSNVMTRVEPEVKEQAEAVLNQLGISMSTAISMYLNQIALHRKIPFEMALPLTAPINISSLSDQQFDKLMEHSILSYQEGKYSQFSKFKEAFLKEISL